MQILPNGRCQFIDSSGAPLASGTVGFYAPGTLNPLTTYQDQAGTIPNANPVSLDSRGQALIWGSGTYRQILKDASGVTIWDAIVSSSTSAGDLAGPGGAALVGYDTFTLAQILTNNLNRVVSSIASLRALSKTLYTHAFVSGYYAQGDGGGGDYWYDSTDTTTADNGGTVIVASDGGRWKLDHINTSVSVKQFGAKGDWNGTTGTDDTAAFQKAAATGLNVYIPSTTTSGYLIKDAVTLSTQSQIIYGDGRSKTFVNVNSTFNMAATGVFISAGNSVEYRDFAILFVQPDTTVKASLTSYPPAISGLNIPGQRVLHMHISRATVGIDWRDNTGQSMVSDLLMSAFNIGIWLDGAVDSVRIEDFHFWPSDLTTNQTTIMTTTGGPIGMYVGRCDDLKVTGGLFYCWNPFSFFTGVRANAGFCFGTIENCDMDGYGGIIMSAGEISVVGGVQTAGTLAAPKLIQSGGTILYSGVQFQIGANFPATPLGACMIVNGAGSVFTMTGCSVYKPNDACFIYSGNGQVNFTANNLIHQTNATFIVAFIAASGSGTVMATNNQCSPLGTGAQPFFVAATDSPHVITGNQFYGHTISAPAGIGYYSGNINGVTNKDLYNNLVIGGLRTKTATVTANGSGVATWAHGISSGNLKVLFMSAYYKGPSTEMIPMTATTLDPTNAIATLVAAAGAHVRISVMYIETIDAVW